MGISNFILNLLKIWSGKIITKSPNHFFLENLLKIFVSHLAIKTYYPYAKSASKNLLEKFSEGRFLENIIIKLLSIIKFWKKIFKKKKKNKKNKINKD